VNFTTRNDEHQRNAVIANSQPSFRAESADASSSRFAPANRSADAERNLSSIFAPGNLSKSLLAFPLLAFTLNAQAPTPVPVAQEPHHHKVFENSYVRVLRVSIPANESTLLHQHDLSYVYVSLGPADIINAVQGKPEVHPKLVDGQVGYAKGGFAHVATAVGIPFNNVTVELVGDQGEPRNLCERIVAGDAGNCDLSRDNAAAPIRTRPIMETDRTLVESLRVRSGNNADSRHERPGLLIAVNGAPIKISGVSGASGATSQTLHVSEILWLPAGSAPKFVVDGPESRLLLISSKAQSAKP
jgi:hypothetical protein